MSAITVDGGPLVHHAGANHDEVKTEHGPAALFDNPQRSTAMNEMTHKHPGRCSAGRQLAHHLPLATVALVAGLVACLVAPSVPASAAPSGTWTPMAGPLPANAASAPYAANPYVYDVSCPTTGGCAAVGTYNIYSASYGGQVSEPLLLSETAPGSWAGREAPLPQNAAPPAKQNGESNELYSVSCGAAGQCAAVGSYVTTSGSISALLEASSNGSWYQTQAPVPANAAAGGQGSLMLSAASCASGDFCMAVGQYNDVSGASDGLIDTLSGGTWHAVEAPLPSNAAGSGSQSVYLYDASCSSP
ncbi:MAG: hypothetical protein ACYDD6_09355, partial [Acidimicrobiales bacterium]